MSYSTEIAFAITDFLQKDEWNYNFDDEREVIRMGVNLKNKIGSAQYFIDLRDDKYMVFLTFPVKADEDSRPAVLDLINRINYDMIFSNFEMDMNDGEVRIRMAIDCDQCLPSEEVVKDSIYIPAMMAEQYGNALMKVMMGIMPADLAYIEANRERDERRRQREGE